jgi:hypothetical protein
MKYDKALLSGLGYIAICVLCVWIGLNVESWRGRNNRPEILILSETFVSNWEGRTVLLVDYTVGGIATNATFYEHQMQKYNALMKHLQLTGRVSR